MFPTRHAIQRYQQRVAPVSTHDAFKTLQTAAVTARRRATPRWWTPISPAPGLLFLYPATLPGVCLLCRDGAILTVFERHICRRWAFEELPPTTQPGRHVPYRRPPAGSLLRDAA